MNSRHWRGLVDAYYILDFEMAGRNKHHFSQYATVKRGDRVELAHEPRSRYALLEEVKLTCRRVELFSSVPYFYIDPSIIACVLLK